MEEQYIHVMKMRDRKYTVQTLGRPLSSIREGIMGEVTLDLIAGGRAFQDFVKCFFCTYL